MEGLDESVALQASPFTYRCAGVDTLPCVTSVSQKRGESNEKVKVVRQYLVEVPCTPNPRSRDNLPVVVCGVLQKFVLIQNVSFLNGVNLGASATNAQDKGAVHHSTNRGKVLDRL